MTKLASRDPSTGRQTPTFPLLLLPAEVRNKVYRKAFKWTEGRALRAPATRDPSTERHIPTFPLMLLPAEVRYEVYRQALKTNQTIYIDHTREGPKIDAELRVSAGSIARYPDQWPARSTALLQVSKLVHREASPILYRENIFSYRFFMGKQIAGHLCPFSKFPNPLTYPR